MYKKITQHPATEHALGDPDDCAMSADHPVRQPLPGDPLSRRGRANDPAGTRDHLRLGRVLRGDGRQPLPFDALKAGLKVMDDITQENQNA